MTADHRNDVLRALSVLKGGGVIVYPTETVYGIGCDPMKRESFERIAALKGRETGKPMLLLASSLEQVESFAGKLDSVAGKIARAFWPGPVTMVISPLKPLPDYLYGSGGGVAFRVTPHRLAGDLARGLGRPIISTSANLSGQPPVRDYKEATDVFDGLVDMILETSEQMIGVPSTLIDISDGHITLLREGGLPLEKIMEVL